MKKSTLFLCLALTVPAGLALAGVALGARTSAVAAINTPGNNDREFESDRLGALFGGEKSNKKVTTLKEGVFKVNRALELSASGAELALSFDPALKGEAKVKVEASKDADPRIEMSASSLEFGVATNGGARLRVTIILPADLDKLELETKATSCLVESDTPVTLQSFTALLEATRCDFEFDSLKATVFDVKAQSATIDFEVESLESRRPYFEINAGKFSFDAKRGTFESADRSNGLRVVVAAGKGDFRIRSLPEHNVDVRMKAGSLELRRGGSTERLKGLNQERRIESRAGAPEVELEVNAGSLEMRIDEVGGPQAGNTL